MPDGKYEHRLGSAVVIPERSSRKSRRGTEDHYEHYSDDERHRRSYSGSKMYNEMQRTRLERRRNNDEREERARGEMNAHFRRGGNYRGQPKRSPHGKADHRDFAKGRTDIRYPSVSDLDPSDVPRSGKYFLHDNRESGQSNRRGTWRSRGPGRRLGGSRDRRRSRSPIWKHDKFEEIVEQDTVVKDIE